VAIAKDLRLKPIVAFDVDGVLRVGKIQGFAQDLISFPVTMDEREYPTLFHGSPKWDAEGLSPREEHFSRPGVELLRSLVDDPSMEPVWATTWQRWANYYFAKPLGIPELPVAVESEDDGAWYSSSPSWKVQQLARKFPGRPLLWLDDNLPDRGPSLEALRRPSDYAITLSFSVNPWNGLTEANVEFIREWLALASSEEGQKELRARRSEDLKEQRAYRATRKRQDKRRREVLEATKGVVEELFPAHEEFVWEVANLASRGVLDGRTLAAAAQRAELTDVSELAKRLRVKL